MSDNIRQIKDKAKEGRNMLQQGIYKVINPFVRLLIKMHITPNMVTTIGLLGNIAAAALIFYAGNLAQEGTKDYFLLTLAGILIIAFSLFDMLDGQVARLGGMVSRFGAMYDSVLDRYCELLMFGSIAYYLLLSGSTLGAILGFCSLIGSVMVSYVRARAEGLDIECKIGFMQRPERVVVCCVALLATGITGQCAKEFNADIILIVAMAVIAVFANLTAFARIEHCRRAMLKNNKL